MGGVPPPDTFYTANLPGISQMLTFFLFDEKSATTIPIWYVDGRPATNEEIDYIKSFLPKKSSNRQGLERENVVQVRVVKIENVVAITTDGETTTFEEWRA